MFNEKPAIALIHNYDLIDEVVESMNITFQDYCNNFTGSFMFGYIKALQSAGLRPILFCITSQVSQPTRFEHLPTGTTICALPYPKIYNAYLAIKNRSLKAYGAKKGQAFKDVEDSNSIRRSGLNAVKDFIKSGGTYLATPLNLLAQELQKENCQAFLCQEYEYARFDACVAMGKRINLPVYACFQGLDRTQSILEWGFRRWALDNCAGLIIASGREIKRVQKKYNFPQDKIHQIFNPLDLVAGDCNGKISTRQELGISPTAKVVVWHGRVEIEQKGLDILALAWQEICQSRPKEDLCLFIIGTGSDAPRWQKQIDSLSLEEIVWVNEFISDRHLLSRYLTAADLYTLPSRKEGFPLAPIEAMACGLPVVLADAAGIRDILPREEEDGGLIVPRENSTALATAIGKLLDDENLRNELSQKAKQRAENSFSLQGIGERMRNTFNI